MAWDQLRGRALLAGVGCAVSVAVVLVLVNELATEYVADSLRRDLALRLARLPVGYGAFSWMKWELRYGRATPDVFARVHVAIVGATCTVLLGAALAYGLLARGARRRGSTHGTAHFATESEVLRTGLLTRSESTHGVYVGAFRDSRGRLQYLRHDGPEHVLALAPTRSGKGVGLVIPTLLSWPASVIVHDLKGELWELTSGWRSSGGRNVVLKFDPAASHGSSAFNPLEEIRLGTLHEVADVQNLVTILVDPEGKGLQDHWAKTAHALLTGVVIHLLYDARAQGRVAMLADLALALSDPQQPVDELYKAMLSNGHLGGDQHPVVAAAARDMLNRPAEERGSVLSSAMSFLSIYRDPLVAQNTARSDFKIADLMDCDRPVSLYLVVRPADKDRLRPVMRLVVNQIVRVLVREGLRFRDGELLPPHRHRLLLMLDEFPSFGKLEVFQEALAYLAGYGIKAYLVAQDLAQLWAAYGRDESIVSNCHVRVAFAPNKLETAEWLSKMLGVTSLVTEDYNPSGGRFAMVLGHVARTVQEARRPLRTPDECMRLALPVKDAQGRIVEPGQVLVFVAGHTPILATQILYFHDPLFERRARIPAPPSGTIAGPQRARFRFSDDPATKGESS